MLKAIVAFSLRFRGIVIALACLAFGYGIYSALTAKLGAFPEFAPPQTMIQTEAPGLAPEQVRVLSLSEKVESYAVELTSVLRNAGYRAESDIRNEKLGFKVREAELAKVPYMVVVGEREAANRSVSLRKLRGEKSQALTVETLIEMMRKEPLPA